MLLLLSSSWSCQMECLHQSTDVWTTSGPEGDSISLPYQWAICLRRILSFDDILRNRGSWNKGKVDHDSVGFGSDRVFFSLRCVLKSQSTRTGIKRVGMRSMSAPVPSFLLSNNQKLFVSFVCLQWTETVHSA